MSTKLEPLSEREIAILQGNDPDAIARDEDIPADDMDVAEQVSDSEGTDAPEQDTGAETETESESWIDDSARSLAASYGISEDELGQFGSADEFRRAAILLDRNLAKPAPEIQEEAQEEAKPEESLDLEYYKQNYDDHVAKLAERVQAQDKSLRDTQDFIANYQAQQQQLAYQRHIETFHALADQLDKDRYGSVEDGSAVAKDSNRRKLYEAAETLRVGLEARGQKVPAYQELLKRAEHVAFGEELLKAKQDKMRQEIAEQSKRRRPVAGSRPSRAQTTSKAHLDPIAAIVNDPKVVAFWNKAQEDNGT